MLLLNMKYLFFNMKITQFLCIQDIEFGDQRTLKYQKKLENLKNRQL